jgi:hypothetical protein
MRFRSVVVAVLALSLLTCRSREQAVKELDARLATEVARLEASMSTLDRSKLPEDLAGLATGFGDSFARIKATKSPLLRLYRLRDTFIGVETLQFFAANPNAAKTMPALTSLANARRVAYEAKFDAGDGPLLYRALSEAAGNRALVLYRASVPYGKISDPMWGGLYYLAEAEGNFKFRAFVDSLPEDVAPGDEQPGDREQLVAAANRLESEAVSAFEQDPVGGGAIPASAKLKEARELLAADLLDGATLALVETKLALGRRKAAADPGSITEGAKPSPQTEDKRESIPALLQAYVREGPPPVNIIVDRDVVPFYASLLQPAPASKVVSQVIPNQVTVTLVRWPYT